MKPCAREAHRTGGPRHDESLEQKWLRNAWNYDYDYHSYYDYYCYCDYYYYYYYYY
jgi:hypothetical protein